MSKKNVGVIPARFRSSRFEGKPLVKILGKEMVQWVYEHSKQSKLLNEIYVATDDENIASFCQRHDIPFMMTLPTHRNCSERSNEICQRVGADYVVEIQGDEPVLLAEEIDNFIERSFEKKDLDVSLFCTDASLDEVNNPHIVKLVMDKNDKALFFSRSPIPMNFKSRPVRYLKQIGLYVWKADALKRFSALPVGDLERIEDTHTLRLIENRFEAYLIYTSQQTVGVDIPEDIAKVEAFIKRQPSLFGKEKVL